MEDIPSATMAFKVLGKKSRTRPTCMASKILVKNFLAGLDSNWKVAKATRFSWDILQAAEATSNNLCDVQNKASKGRPVIYSSILEN